MSAFPAPEALPATTARLRGAGCVFAEDEAHLLVDAAADPDQLERMVHRRTQGEPLEVILGWAEFCGLRIAVGPHVFVPRKRTEFLVHHAAELTAPGAIVVDLGCGSGAVGAAIAATRPGIELHATDIDPAAVRCARRNITPPHGQVHEGDLYRPLPAALRGRVDLLVVNAPYVPSADIASMPPEAREHEPRVALDGGADGLDVQRRIAAEAPRWLAPGAHLLIETSERQTPRTVDALARSGLAVRIAGTDELGTTVVVGTAPTTREHTRGDG